MINANNQGGIAPEHQRWLFWLFILASLLLGYNTFSHLKDTIGDEGVHSFQIYWLIGGKFEIFEHLTMPPVYHAVIAALAKVFESPTMNDLRFVHMLFAAPCIVVFYLLTRRFHADQAPARTLQFVYLPFLFPLFFLIYTDIPSLIFTLGMIERTVRRKYVAAAVLALVAVFIRQPNLIWVAYACCFVLLEEEKIAVTKEFVIGNIRKLLPFAVVFVLFGVFVVINGGVAVGDSEQHPVSFNLSNLYFFLIVSFALFLPYSIAQAKSVFELVYRHKWIVLLVIAGFFLYMATYEHPHKYNSAQLSYYRHNLIIHYTADIKIVRILSYIAIAWMALVFAVTALRSPYRRQLLLLLPFAALSFVPMPLIEQRYYIPALALFMALRPAVNWRIEAVTAVYYILASSYIAFNVSRATFFL